MHSLLISACTLLPFLVTITKGQATPPHKPMRLALCTKAHPCGETKPLDTKTADVRPQDVKTIDGMVSAYYDVVSGPKGLPRQWSRDRTLYSPDLRFISVDDNKRTNELTAMIMDHQTYAELSQGLSENGFFEKEVHRVTHQFGHIAHVFSTYESRRTPDGPVIARGINSLELLFDGQRWWITFAEWDEERPGQPIPKEFLP